MVAELLRPEDERAIEEAVARIERQSASEIVVAVLERSSDYWHWRVVLAGCWAIGTALALDHFVPALGDVVSFVVELPLAVAFYALLGVPALHRLLIAPDVAAAAVLTRACAVFAERGVHRTRGRTGLLILVSRLERRVVVRGDDALDAAVGNEGWARLVARLTARIRAGEAAAGLLDALSELEPTLARVAPRTADDVNELPDAIVKG